MESASNSISLMSISGPQQVTVGGTIQLSSDSPADNGEWGLSYREYTHNWSASPSNRVSISNGSNSGATIEGLRTGSVTITHEWGYNRLFGGWNHVDRETYTVEVVAADPDDLCTIMFNPNGGIWDDPLNGTHQFLVGHELWEAGKDLSVPTKSGYVFEGWTPNVSRVVTDDAEYTAQWKAAPAGTTPVYVYLKVTGNTDGLILNGSGWYTIGVIYMPSDVVPAPQYQDQQVDINKSSFQSALSEAMSSIVRYGPNASLEIDEAEWTQLHVQNGANDYVPSGSAWHLDGTIDAAYLANLTVNHIDVDTNEILATSNNPYAVGTIVNPRTMAGSFKNYEPVRYDPDSSFAIKKDSENVINIYYKKGNDRLIYDANGGEGTMTDSIGRAEEPVTVKPNEFKRKEYQG